MSNDGPEPVEVSVFDAAGRLVRTLEPTLLPPGVTEIVWDGRDEGGHSVSAGVYFLRWRNDDGAGARPIVVVK